MTFTDQEAAIAVLAVERLVIDPLQALEAIKAARAKRRSPLEEIIRTGLVADRTLLQAVAKELGLQFVDLFSQDTSLRPSMDVFGRVNMTWLEQFVAVPMLDGGGRIVVATNNPDNPALNDYLNVTFPEGFRIVLALGSQVRQLLTTEQANLGGVDYDNEDQAAAQAELVGGLSGRAPVLEWIDATLTSAISQNASDLHFEMTGEGRMLVRFRIDGELINQNMPLRGREMEAVAAMLSRAQMDPANMREPQDGSFSFNTSSRRIDVRASMIPLITGPKLVLRLLDPGNLRSLDELGFSLESLALMRYATRQPQGLIVVAGPTGSGKTTSLYAMLREVATMAKNVMTIENPVEYRLPLVSQIPVRDDLGDRSVTFGRALRTILRLDPDVILVGEVRDSETARVAMDAALTGHLVLTTIHAPSAFGVFTRFIEMGAPPYLVSEAMSLSVSQRLVRRLHECKRLEIPNSEQRQALQEAGFKVPDRVAASTGCAVCRHKGFKGRIAVAEVVAPDMATRSAIALRASAGELSAAAAGTKGFVSYQVSLQRLLDTYDTTPAEALRALASADLS